MSQLQPVTLKFDGKEYKIDKDDSIWGLIEAIEDVISFLELAPKLSNNSFSSAKIFRAYAAALNYAGAKVTPKQVRDLSGYKDLGTMAGNLTMIMMMAQPGKDIDLGAGVADDSGADELKKKAAGE